MRLEAALEGSIYDGTDLTKLSNGSLSLTAGAYKMIFQDPFASLDQRMTVSRLIAGAYTDADKGKG